ncbi:MAG: hypothetical protein AAGA81_04630 [Acidobacteriota bacterium]
MKRVAFITCAKKPDLTDDDQAAAEALARDVAVEPLVWGGAAERWQAFDLLVLRSCWDYHLRRAEFLDWLEAVERSGTPLENTPQRVAWNSEKTYLRELEAAGLDTVPTEWLSAAQLLEGGGDAVRRRLAERSWDRAVLKPTVSASGLHTFTTSPELLRMQEAEIRAAASHGDLMLQPFLPEIEARGEWSLLFFGGEFSHAVLKKARDGEFRVQSDFGGSATLAEAPPALIADAKRVLRVLGRPPLYARIDGVDRDGRLLLVEAELIEPQLFLRLDEQAPRRFAEALKRRL